MSEDNYELPNELEVLKERATLLGVSFHPNISLTKLKAKIEEAQSDGQEKEVLEEAEAKPLSKVGRKLQLRKEAEKLIRINVNCMDPAKREWDGELYTVSNSFGTFRRFVKFNTVDGWHVPQIIYKHMKERKCQVFHTVTNSKGEKERKGKLIPELSIEVLPPLTKEELQALARRQAMTGAIDNELSE